MAAETTAQRFSGLPSNRLAGWTQTPWPPSLSPGLPTRPVLGPAPRIVAPDEKVKVHVEGEGLPHLKLNVLLCAPIKAFKSFLAKKMEFEENFVLQLCGQEVVDGLVSDLDVHDGVTFYILRETPKDCSSSLPGPSPSVAATPRATPSPSVALTPRTAPRAPTRDLSQVPPSPLQPQSSTAPKAREAVAAEARAGSKGAGLQADQEKPQPQSQVPPSPLLPQRSLVPKAREAIAAEARAASQGANVQALRPSSCEGPLGLLAPTLSSWPSTLPQKLERPEPQEQYHVEERTPETWFLMKLQLQKKLLQAHVSELKRLQQELQALKAPVARKPTMADAARVRLGGSRSGLGSSKLTPFGGPRREGASSSRSSKKVSGAQPEEGAASPSHSEVRRVTPESLRKKVKAWKQAAAQRKLQSIPLQLPQAAERIQRAWRNFKQPQVRWRMVWKGQAAAAAAGTVQRFFRGFRIRLLVRRYKAVLAKVRREEKAGAVIRAHALGMITRSRLRRLKQCAAIIQRFFRLRLAEVRLRRLRLGSAVKIQALLRGARVRLRFKGFRRILADVVRIQSAFRGAMVRWRILRLQSVVRSKAILLQRAWRRRLAWKRWISDGGPPCREVASEDPQQAPCPPAPITGRMEFPAPRPLRSPQPTTPRRDRAQSEAGSSKAVEFLRALGSLKAEQEVVQVDTKETSSDLGFWWAPLRFIAAGCTSKW